MSIWSVGLPPAKLTLNAELPLPSKLPFIHKYSKAITKDTQRKLDGPDALTLKATPAALHRLRRANHFCQAAPSQVSYGEAAYAWKHFPLFKFKAMGPIRI